MANEPFHVEVVWPAEGICVVDVAGEVDIYTAPRLGEALAESVSAAARRVIVDFSSVRFVDSTGLGVLMGCAKDLLRAGGSLDIVCVDENIKRIFEITGLTGVFGFYPSRAAALAQ